MLIIISISEKPASPSAFLGRSNRNIFPAQTVNGEMPEHHEIAVNRVFLNNKGPTNSFGTLWNYQPLATIVPEYHEGPLYSPWGFSPKATLFCETGYTHPASLEISDWHEAICLKQAIPMGSDLGQARGRTHYLCRLTGFVTILATIRDKTRHDSWHNPTCYTERLECLRIRM